MFTRTQSAFIIARAAGSFVDCISSEEIGGQYIAFTDQARAALPFDTEEEARAFIARRLAPLYHGDISALVIVRG